MLQTRDDTYIISDLHLTHQNIIKYCNRPYEQSPDGVAKMKEDILSLFDNLPTSCEIWNLGDLFDTKPHTLAEARKVVDRMKGKKRLRKLYLILGNHDCCREPNRSKIQFYYDAGFDKVYDSPILINDKYILSHEPVYISKESNLCNIYGHTHDIPITEDYFTKDFDNWAMIAKVCRKNGQPEPDIEKFVKWPERIVNIKHYMNVCLDNLHEIVKLNDVIGKLND